MHIYDIPATEVVSTYKWLGVSQKSYFPLILSIKLCILFGYLRIFKIDRLTKWAIWFGTTACGIFYIVTFFVDLFRCKPIAAAWNPSIEGTCMSYAAFPWATGIFNMISDFYILLVPLPPILKLNMPLAQRIRIVSIFSLGVFTCVASVMRFVISTKYADDPDQTYISAKVLYWTVLEINIGLICACATTFRAFFVTGTPKSLGSLVRSLLGDRSASRTNVASLPGSRKSGDDSYRSSEEGGQGRTRTVWNLLSRPSKPDLRGQTAGV
ncbi:hypothetical protein F5Y15DRAFT_396094 [Xylariaceae sp. FL0016]|nr:hypothetical protein F5Y15DRAFT_396094 [Xylariaceae sp. FL0016]